MSFRSELSSLSSCSTGRNILKRKRPTEWTFHIYREYNHWLSLSLKETTTISWFALVRKEPTQPWHASDTTTNEDAVVGCDESAIILQQPTNKDAPTRKAPIQCQIDHIDLNFRNRFRLGQAILKSEVVSGVYFLAFWWSAWIRFYLVYTLFMDCWESARIRMSEMIYNKRMINLKDK